MFVLTTLHEWIYIDSLLTFFKSILFFIILYGQAQINRFYIFPYFINDNKKKFFLLSLISTLIGCLLLFTANYYYWMDKEYYQQQNIIASIIYNYVLCIITLFMVLFIHLIQLYYIESQQRLEDKILINEMKFKLLSSQLNPHFFFNMLNNLYGISLTNSKKLPKLIIRLSQLMRYQLEHADKFEVMLSDEMLFISNYVDMEKERIGKRCRIKFIFPNDTPILQQYNIAPLIIITLVENAFKHSINNKNWFVNILITLEDKILTINIENSLSDRLLTDNSTGIGLKNIRQHMDFLYKEQYKMIHSQDEFNYQVILSLELRKNTS